MTVPISRLEQADQLQPAARPVNRDTYRDTGETRTNQLAQALVKLGGAGAQYGSRYLAAKAAGQEKTAADEAILGSGAADRAYAAGYTDLDEAAAAGVIPRSSSPKWQEGAQERMVSLMAKRDMLSNAYLRPELAQLDTPEDIEVRSREWLNDRIAALPAYVRNDEKLLAVYTGAVMNTVAQNTITAASESASRNIKSAEDAVGLQVSLDAARIFTDSKTFTIDPGTGVPVVIPFTDEMKAKAFAAEVSKTREQAYASNIPGRRVNEMIVESAVKEAVASGNPALLHALRDTATGPGGATFGTTPALEIQIQKGLIDAASSRGTIARRKREEQAAAIEGILDQQAAAQREWRKAGKRPEDFDFSTYEEQIAAIDPSSADKALNEKNSWAKNISTENNERTERNYRELARLSISDSLTESAVRRAADNNLISEDQKDNLLDMVARSKAEKKGKSETSTEQSTVRRQSISMFKNGDAYRDAMDGSDNQRRAAADAELDLILFADSLLKSTPNISRDELWKALDKEALRLTKVLDSVQAPKRAPTKADSTVGSEYQATASRFRGEEQADGLDPEPDYSRTYGAPPRWVREDNDANAGATRD